MQSSSARQTKGENLFEGQVHVYLNPKILYVLLPIFIVQDTFIAFVVAHKAILALFLMGEATILGGLYYLIFKKPTVYMAYLNKQFLILAGKQQSISYPIVEISSMVAFMEQKNGKLQRGVKVTHKERTISLLLDQPDALVSAFMSAK